MAYKEIPLTRGFVTIVDEADYDWLSKWKWHYTAGGYAGRCKRISGNKGKNYQVIMMHRILMDTPLDMQTDHINGNKLDNRRGNLRIVTALENCHNRRIKRHDNLTGVEGVFWNVVRQKWQASIKVNYKSIYLGLFKYKIQAIAVRKKAEKRYGFKEHFVESKERRVRDGLDKMPQHS